MYFVCTLHIWNSCILLHWHFMLPCNRKCCFLMFVSGGFVAESANSQIIFWESTIVLWGQNCILSKGVWLASWDQITVSVQSTGSSFPLGMKHNCVSCGRRKQNCKSLLCVEDLCLSCCLSTVNIWVWTAETKSFILVQEGKCSDKSSLAKITLQLSAPNPLSHKNESEFSTLPQ